MRYIRISELEIRKILSHITSHRWTFYRNKTNTINNEGIL